MNRPGRSLQLAGLSIALTCCLASFGPIPKEADDPPKEPSSYVRPIKIDGTIREILETSGTSRVGFEYQIPADKQAVFILVARDDKQIIKSLSKVVTIAPHEENEPNRGSLKLTMIDPAKFTEGYKGKVRWVFNFSSLTQSEWEPGLYATAHTRSTWTEGKTVNDPETKKDYLLWEIKAYPPGLHGIMKDTPTIFDYQILFCMEPREKSRSDGSIGIGEYETMMKARKKDTPF